MKDCNSMSTPMNPNEKLSKPLNDTKDEKIDVPYREIIGKLQYAVFLYQTRPCIRSSNC